jgi:hypothetical protein
MIHEKKSKTEVKPQNRAKAFSFLRFKGKRQFYPVGVVPAGERL